MDASRIDVHRFHQCLPIPAEVMCLPAGAGSLELPPWQVVRQGLLALPFRFGAAVTHRLLQVWSASSSPTQMA